MIASGSSGGRTNLRLIGYIKREHYTVSLIFKLIAYEIDFLQNRE